MLHQLRRGRRVYWRHDRRAELLATLDNRTRVRPSFVRLAFAIIKQHLPLEVLFVPHLRRARRERPWHMTGVALSVGVFLAACFHVYQWVEVESVEMLLDGTLPLASGLLLLLVDGRQQHVLL